MMNNYPIALDYLRRFDDLELYETVESMGFYAEGEVFVAQLKTEFECAPIGLPWFIVVRDDKAQSATLDEMMRYHSILDYLLKDRSD